ncbi:NBR1-Ig-like domain-containing protein [Micromonospora yasonensis]|uniref:NBR1-Ig-like domain-containing protein n=1 Tax=Micromonospora yasonensis TaxID=1128667 RepID=UPI00222EE5FD|nr:NBR1-Ig-like domain-containing protein [Micromonospora yasonensis]MCW3843948.1 NBR1-Ig-like domain-containing protein [Micromonospora yasonensis]
MRAAQAREVIGSRMRELRESAEVSLTQAAALSGWGKGHLSRVERGLTKPSRGLVEWYDATFGAGQALLGQFLELEVAVRAGRETSLRDARLRQATGAARFPTVVGGTVPVDHDPADCCLLVAENPPDGAEVPIGQVFDKTWTLRNAGPVHWHGRWLTRQGTPGVAGWLQSPLRVPLGEVAPGAEAVIRVRLRAPRVVAACTAYFKLTDAAGRLYFPGSESRPLHCTINAVERDMVHGVPW